MSDETLPAAGWYPDPTGAPALRWWNGVTWSDVTHPLEPGRPAPSAPLSVPPTAPEASTQVWAPVVPAAAAAVPAEADAPPRRRWWIPVVAAVALLALALTAVGALLSSTGSPRLDTDAVATRIAAQLTDEVGRTVHVSCPSRVEIHEGDSFTCTASTDDGATEQVVVRQTTDQGDVEWDLAR